MGYPRFIASISPFCLALACATPQPAPESAPPASGGSPLPPASIQTGVAPAVTAAPAPDPKLDAAQASPKPAVRFAEGLSTPESVLYDEGADRYLVSNINGKPDGVDNNGYITELSPEGKVVKEKLIAGGTGKTKLDAPKGLGIHQGVLYVADINVVRKFDAKTGDPKGDIAVPGATFLNDIAIGPDGRVFVSDSGLKSGAADFEPTGTDAVYVIDKGKLKTLAKSKDLKGPNGLLVWDKSVLVSTFSANELFRLDDKGGKADITQLPEGGLDGIVSLGDTLLVTSWKSSSIYRGKLGQKFEVVLSGFKGPADIGYDTKRKRVLVPRFLENVVEAYDLH